MGDSELCRRHDIACRFLVSVEPLFAQLLQDPETLPVLVPRDQTPFEALVRAVAGQQLHGKAAEAILGRFVAQSPGGVFPTPEALLAMPETALRACGFSAGKIAALRDIAAKTADGTVPDRAHIDTMTDRELIDRLITLRGVGCWTVEMMLIFTLGRPDILPVDDFGVRQGWKVLKGLEAQPKPRALATIGAAWSPHRSTAARLLWRAADNSKAPQASAG